MIWSRPEIGWYLGMNNSESYEYHSIQSGFQTAGSAGGGKRAGVRLGRATQVRDQGRRYGDAVGATVWKWKIR